MSETLRSVGRGEQVRVTVRGEPTADIVPAAGATGEEELRKLVAAGRLTPPSRARPPRAPKLVRDRASASAIVLAERGEER